MTCHTPTQLPKSSRNSFVPATLHITIFVCQNLQPIVPQTLCFQDGGRGRGTPQIPQFITNRVVEVYTRFLNSSRVAYEMIKWCAAALAFLLLPIAAAAQGTPAGTIYGYAPRSRPSPRARRAHRCREHQHRRNPRRCLQSARVVFRARAPARPLQHHGRGQRIQDRSPDRDRA